jgi:adenine specific DNA methylase Mod
LFKSDSDQIDQSYRLFPGYNNLIDTNVDGIGDEVVNQSLNDGLSDMFVRPSVSDEFLEYQFTANDLEEFNAFSIKIVASGTNESDTPRFADIRAIALV